MEKHMAQCLFGPCDEEECENCGIKDYCDTCGGRNGDLRTHTIWNATVDKDKWDDDKADHERECYVGWATICADCEGAHARFEFDGYNDYVAAVDLSATGKCSCEGEFFEVKEDGKIVGYIIF